MGPKRHSIDDEYGFVAYDPKKKTCTAADRSLIKRLAGKQGSETKKRRLRQEKASRTTSFSHTHVRDNESGVSSASETESQHPPQRTMARASSVTSVARSHTGEQDLDFPDYTNNNFWAQIEPSDWQSVFSHAPAATSKSWDGTDQTPSISVSQHDLTLAHSETCSNDFQDCFSLRSEFREPDFIDHGRQGSLADRTQQHAARPFGSFDSGFQDNDSFDYDFAHLDDQCDLANEVHSLEDDPRVSNIPSAMQSLGESGQREISVHSTKYNLTAVLSNDQDLDALERNALSENRKQSNGAPRLDQIGLSTPPVRPSPHIERRPSEQYSPRAPIQSSWPNIDSVLVKWVQYKEKKGQLCQGSSSECLGVLSECEEARSLWRLNLSLVSPKLVLRSDRPNDIYARAKSRLRSMTPGQRLDVEGILMKLGIAEYVAISFALEVTSLQQDVATRKDLGIWSKAEAIVDHRLADLAPGSRSVLNHLLPDEEEVESLRGVS